MRFFFDGPSIPDQLLERRDQGRVVFLCGAGVSLNAGMPSFTDLTKHVVKFFNPPEVSQIATSFRPWEEGLDGPKVPLDQIFNLLYQEYGREDVNALVAERLWVDNSGEQESSEHKIIARISSDQEGKPQIVTTNFDRLFERTVSSRPGSNIYEPPAFPDINLGVPLTGITYLHGRLQKPDAKQHSYVLSSADFGRAYLSEGWATNFIRSLLNRYTVVLVGYQAEDPPVKYLLQGLNHDGLSDRSNLYAFDKGRPEEIEAKWRDLGVSAIAYEDHSCLWKSFEAWAVRADDPRRWRSKVIDLAMNGPRQVAAYERGQVTHLVRSTPGARLFANADPAPPAEWLCVFDASCRAAEKSRGYGEDAETFDPLEIYGLDDDPPRPSESGRRTLMVHDHILEWRRGDTNPPSFHRLSGRQIAGVEDMPPRLFYLSKWISKHLGSPAAAWWALRQLGLHPRLSSEIHRELSRITGLNPEARRIWNLILEYQSDSRNFSWDGSWFDLKDRIKNEGWCPSVLRDFELITSPILSRTLPSGVGASKPPFKSWEETNPSELANWEIKLHDRHEEAIDIPAEVLEQVFSIVERQLHKAVGLLQDINTTYFDTPSCYPNREVEGEEPDRNDFFTLFLELFMRMTALFPASARSHAIIWPTEAKYYFKKLKLFALNHVELFEADEAAEIVMSLNQESYWDTNVRRELLFLISDRWEDFSKANKVALAERMLRGPDRMDHWSEDKYIEFQNGLACRYTRWLTLQGRDLSPDLAKRLDDKISRLPEWNDGLAISYVTEHHGGSGWVSTDDRPDAIVDLPINKVLERAKADLQRNFESFAEKRPFTGLVKANPRKALAALSDSARKGDYPKEFWSALISEWPEETKPRLFNVFLNRLSRLPEETIRELSHTVGRWIENKFVTAYKFDKDLAWKTFDHLVSGMNSEGGVATLSGIRQILVAGELVQKSRRTFSHASSGPIGEATQGLISALNSLKLDQSHGIPEEFKSRFERLIAAPGEGGDHVIAILTHQLSWLHYLDPEWVMNRIMPWFNFEHSAAEPAWNGFLSAARCPPQAIGNKLNPMLIELFPKVYQWSWDQGLARIATQIIVELAVFRNPDGLNPNEARLCLRNMNDQNRQDAVSRLGNIGQREKDGWSAHVIPFVNTVWPRERGFRTSTLVLSWVSMLDDTGDDFPAVLNAVRRFLVPVEGERHRLYSFSKEIGGKKPLTVKFPDAVLELLDAVVPNSAEDVPYDLPQIIDLIEESDSSLAQDRRFLRLINLIEQT